MFNLFIKIFRTKSSIIPFCDIEKEDIDALGGTIHDRVKKLFRGSLAIRQVDAGSDNACEQELVALSNAFYDIERFGIHFVASPKHADMLMITGPVTRNMREALVRAYHATPDPKIVVAVGDDAINGGIYKGSYAVMDGVHAVIPVDYRIPGDPPSPKTILSHILAMLRDIENKRSSTSS